MKSHGLYGRIIRSFLYWSGKFSVDRAGQPFNTLLMMSASQMLILVALILLCESASGLAFPLSGSSLTVASVVIFFVNYFLFKRIAIEEVTAAPDVRVRFWAPLFAGFCISVIFLAVIFRLSKG